MTSVERPTPEGDPRGIVDLFAGPGGLDVAARWLGLHAVGVEYDENANKTRVAAELANAVHGDVTHPGNKPSAFPDAKVLAGGPPCQTFTVAGTGTGRRDVSMLQELVIDMGEGKSVSQAVAELEDSRTGMVLQPLKWALQAIQDRKPYEAIILEQVPAVIGIWESVAKVLKVNGYKTWCGILNAEEYGVPQTRRRAIMIARRDRQPVRPLATHHRFVKGAPRPRSTKKLSRWVAMEDALGRKGFEVVSNYGTGGDPGNRGRRRSDEPAFTVTGKVTRNRLEGHGVIEGKSDRLTVKDAGLLQTFPDGFPWSGKDQAQQIGNAVPPRLAAHVLSAALGIPISEEKLNLAVSLPWEMSKSMNIRADDRVDLGSQDSLKGKPTALVGN